MSEHWKSTPKYWCKHCKTYVRDTKFERTQHDATAKHQGNLKRFLRDLHRGHERDERENQRAKNEVERLNKVISGSGLGGSKSDGLSRRTPITPASAPQQVSVGERKRQLAQLADMGIAVPKEFRAEMAMAGDWQTLSERSLHDGVKTEDQVASEAHLSIGIRKRKYEGQEEEEEAGEKVVRKGWGSTTRTYPEASQGDDEDLDALLYKTRVLKEEPGHMKHEEEAKTDLKPQEFPPDGNGNESNAGHSGIKLEIKREDSAEMVPTLPSGEKQIVEPPSEVMFKKRKPKNIKKI